jgi:tRNA(fMet)-specific endonuclease VapC
MIHLDTDTSIAILRGNASVAARLESTTETVAISSLVLAELLFGAEGSRDPAAGEAAIEKLLVSIDVIPFGRNCASEYGRLRLELKRIGRATGETDAFIAATALAYGATLVTHNTKHFQHIPGLKLEDWLATS